MNFQGICIANFMDHLIEVDFYIDYNLINHCMIGNIYNTEKIVFFLITFFI